jgi:protein SDA1
MIILTRLSPFLLLPGSPPLTSNLSLPRSPPPQGTFSTKKKKQRKLARVMQTVKKAERKGQESHSESFAALHLLHDPQSFCEKLFSRMQTGHERFETRLAMIQVVSRIVGVHK